MRSGAPRLDARDDGYDPQPRPQRPDRRSRLAALTGNERFAWDAYRRFIAMFSDIVLGVGSIDIRPGDRADEKALGGVATDPRSMLRRWQAASSSRSKRPLRAHAGAGFSARRPRAAAAAPSARSSTPGTRSARSIIAASIRFRDDWGTAVNVVSMVFGNLGDDSGTGRCLHARSRIPANGSCSASTCVTRKVRTSSQGFARPSRSPISKEMQPEIYGQFVEIAEQARAHYRDMQDLEFTVERGKLYMLQTRSAKRSAEAAVEIALDMVHEGMIERARSAAPRRRGFARPAVPRAHRSGAKSHRSSRRVSTRRPARLQVASSSIPIPRSTCRRQGKPTMLVRERRRRTTFTG